jgi:hypothetical protein
MQGFRRAEFEVFFLSVARELLRPSEPAPAPGADQALCREPAERAAGAGSEVDRAPGAPRRATTS